MLRAFAIIDTIHYQHLSEKYLSILGGATLNIESGSRIKLELVLTDRN